LFVATYGRSIWSTTLRESDWVVYADDFDPSAYDGSDGTRDWSGPWNELGDDGQPASGDVYLYDLVSGTTTPIAARPGLQQAPRVSGRRIVWEDGREGSTSEAVYVYDLDTGIEQKLSPDGVRAFKPDIDGNQVVWHSPGVNGHEIFLKEIGGGPPIQITDAPASQDMARIDKGIVVWRDGRAGNWDVYGYTIASGTEFIVASSSEAEVAPVIGGGRVAYYASAGGGFDVLLYEIGTGQTTQITPDGSTQAFPAIDDEVVVWVDERDGTRDVYAYGLEALPEPDSDGDGVPDYADLCPGFDDSADQDGDGIPDGCDPLVQGYWRFEGTDFGASSLEPADLTPVGTATQLSLGSGPGSAFPRLLGAVPNDQALQLSGGRMVTSDL
ncbi:MAG: kelch repeat-containing protein, partial [Halobacteriales archaeon]|nr:kelch repeat-containing protein [Halobacteriales archaeon]